MGDVLCTFLLRIIMHVIDPNRWGRLVTTFPVAWNFEGLKQFASLTVQLVILAVILSIVVFWVFEILFEIFILPYIRAHRAHIREEREKIEKEEREHNRIWRDGTRVYLERLADGLVPFPGYGTHTVIIREVDDETQLQASDEDGAGPYASRCSSTCR